MTAPLRIAVVYPDLLGTYGDGGNGLVLARRAEWRGYAVELLQAASDESLPEADLYCLGGGEDGPQVRAARSLIDDGTLARRVAEGAVVLAVCAGFQIVGTSFPGAGGDAHEGVGLLDVETVKPAGPRAVGEVLVDLDPDVLGPLPTLTGFENHGGATTRGAGAVALGHVVAGVQGDVSRHGTRPVWVAVPCAAPSPGTLTRVLSPSGLPSNRPPRAPRARTRMPVLSARRPFIAGIRPNIVRRRMIPVHKNFMNWYASWLGHTLIFIRFLR